MKKTKKISQKANKQKTIEVKCECCGELIDLEYYGMFRSYDKEEKRPIFFCDEHCIAVWFGEECEGEDIIEELEQDGYKILNKPESDDEEEGE